MQQIIEDGTADHVVRSLFAVIHNLPTILRSCDLEIDLGTNTSSITDILREGPATRFLAKELRRFIDEGWPAFSKNVNFVWLSPGKQENLLISKEILTTIPSFLRNSQQDEAKITDTELMEIEGWVERLLRSAVVTSRWKSY